MSHCWCKCEAGVGQCGPKVPKLKSLFNAHKNAEENSTRRGERQAELQQLWEEVGEDKLARTDELRDFIAAAVDKAYDTALEEAVRRRTALEESVAVSEKRLREILGPDAVGAIAPKDQPLQQRLNQNMARLKELDSVAMSGYGWVGGLVVLAELRKRITAYSSTIKQQPGAGELEEVFGGALEALTGSQADFLGPTPRGAPPSPAYASTPMAASGDQKPIYQRLDHFYRTLCSVENSWVESFAHKNSGALPPAPGAASDSDAASEDDSDEERQREELQRLQYLPNATAAERSARQRLHQMESARRARREERALRRSASSKENSLATLRHITGSPLPSATPSAALPSTGKASKKGKGNKIWRRDAEEDIFRDLLGKIAGKLDDILKVAPPAGTLAPAFSGRPVRTVNCGGAPLLWPPTFLLQDSVGAPPVETPAAEGGGWPAAEGAVWVARAVVGGGGGSSSGSAGGGVGNGGRFGGMGGGEGAGGGLRVLAEVERGFAVAGQLGASPRSPARTAPVLSWAHGPIPTPTPASTGLTPAHTGAPPLPPFSATKAPLPSTAALAPPRSGGGGVVRPPPAGAPMPPPPPKPAAPPVPRVGGAPPPPPPPPLLKGAALSAAVRSQRESSRLKRSAKMGSLYRGLKSRVDGYGPVGGGGGGAGGVAGAEDAPRLPRGVGTREGMADALAEITRKSAYFRQIEDDVAQHAAAIWEAKAAIESFSTADMAELVKFHRRLEVRLEALTDEGQVLSRFEGFPSKKLAVLRQAAGLYARLEQIGADLEGWKVAGPAPEQLDRINKFFDKLKREVEQCERTREDDEKQFAHQRIVFSFAILGRIKEATVSLSSRFLAHAIKESRRLRASVTLDREGRIPAADMPRARASLQMLWRTFQLAFRVYNFAGGQDETAEQLACALAEEMESYPPYLWAA